MSLAPVELTWWPSPAKLNLFLHINGRRADGYHELQSVFQMLSFGDKLAFEITKSNQIQMMTTLHGVDDKDNLIVKAATKLQSQLGTRLGCNIHVQKNLPMGGGIGGGSSNAATTLRVLNYLWKGELSVQQLADLGLTLGADVPIFVHGYTAFAEGVGEQLIPLQLETKFYLVVFPNCHVSTAEIFAAENLPRDTAKIALADYCFNITQNDCQNLVLDRYPEVANLLQWLLQFAPARMTGTGACVFAMFETETDAEHVFKQLPTKWRAFIARGVDRSPLIDALTARLE